MRIAKYAPEKLYGFCEGEEISRVFFHREVFIAGRWPGITIAPPPIVGEGVVVVLSPNEPEPGKAPRALLVTREDVPEHVQGVVSSFNPQSGWGFIEGEDGIIYYLHRSEVEQGRIPLRGQEARFYKGFKNRRPRACHVRVGKLVR